MKNFGYNLARLWVKIGLYLYFGKIKVSGLSHIPKDKPVLFLSNHQNALLDVLLIGIDCNRKPYFLTRADVFESPILKAIFDIFQMIPIYRIRDGRESLKKNQEVFDRCADLLQNKQAILMFPEANHNLMRRVRPLSKGFTRIIFNALDIDPDLDIQLVPVGLNYSDATKFPSRVALFFGDAISVQDHYDPSDEKTAIDDIKKAVSKKLKTLTTHIEDNDTYNETIKVLDAVDVDYLNPQSVNSKLQNLTTINRAPTVKNKSAKAFKALFTVLNLPIVLIWRIFIRSKVPEPEFMDTMRYGFAMLSYPVYYFLMFVTLGRAFGYAASLLVIFGLFIFNWGYVRFLGSS
ncbi:Phospholipid/glycerol acyltransferase [hydrothermal vent metagenome]|uniref:Phospholipid/glycerol acyltransferase n=1 Tax=hydrothermal vent metagenome TaxID=652676 RepID=A0A3B0T582_9ZZZZ